MTESQKPMRHRPVMALLDDGTLDTVVQCRLCLREWRYTYEADESTDPDDYEDFVSWAMIDAANLDLDTQAE